MIYSYIGADDVAQDKSSLDNYGITHILNLDSDVGNKFEDDYNYKNIAMQDKSDYDLEKVFDDCFDFIDDGRHYGNVFVHCQGTIGLSRSTSICIAYLMNKEKQGFNEAWNNVKEARSFVKPNEGFQKQLKDYEVKLRGAQQVKDSGIDDPFALRKKQEIEQEKAMVAGAASVKNRMKMFGQQLDAGEAPRSKSVSPSPYANKSGESQQQVKSSPQPAPSKWSERQQQQQTPSKSMTPEPKRTWKQQESSKPAAPTSGGPPPPPPPMPTSSLLSNDKLTSNNNNKSNLPPPPPPPPPSADLFSSNASAAKQNKTSSLSSTSKPPHQTATTHSSDRKPSVSETGGGDKMVFGKRPPPPMKIRGGLSIERSDSTSDKNLGYSARSTDTNTSKSTQ